MDPNSMSSPAATPSSSNTQSQQKSTSQPVSNVDTSFNLNRLVLEYLTRKGFNQTEATLRIESTKIPGAQTYNNTNANSNYTQPSTAIPDRTNLQFQQQQFLLNQQQSSNNDDPKLFSRAYILYRSWCENSLEMYKFALEKLLYPFFIYSYLTLIKKNHIEDAHNFLLKFKSDHLLSHSQEIKSLLSITLPDHLLENKYSNLFLNNKYKINLSNTSLNLILSFLNENQSIGGNILVNFLNNNFEINNQLEISNNDTGTLSDNLEGIPEIYQLVNLGPDQDNELLKTSVSSFQISHEKPLKLGPYPNDDDFTKELEAELKHKDENDKSKDEDKPSLMDEYNENFKIDPKNDDSPAKGALPLPQKTVYDLKRAIQEIQDSRSRIKLCSSSYSHLNNNENNQRNVYISQPSLPSVCMYTFNNTNNDLTSLEFHPDSTMIAGGFQDSFVKLWSIDGSPLRSILKNDSYNLDDASSRKLIGHSGPVYGLSYSPDGNYLLSSSADSTVRLWSLDTYSALVSYKGHGGAGSASGSNSPVWDVQFSPLGHYFATASHDQTARLWSCDHIYPLRIFAGHLNDVDVVKFHPNGTYLFTGSSDKTVRMWDIAKAESVRLFVGHTSPISDIACSPDGRWLATCSNNEENFLNNSFGINDWINNSIGGGFQPSGGSTNKSNDKDKDSKDKETNDADATTSEKNKSKAATSMSFSGSVIHVWDIASGRKLKTLRGHGSGGIHSLSWSRGSEVLVSGGADNSVRVWDVKKGTIDTISNAQPERFNPITKSVNVNSKEKDASTNIDNSNFQNYGSSDHMGVYFTKKTPVYKVEFTRRNLCLAAGPYLGIER